MEHIKGTFHQLSFVTVSEKSILRNTFYLYYLFLSYFIKKICSLVIFYVESLLDYEKNQRKPHSHINHLQKLTFQFYKSFLYQCEILQTDDYWWFWDVMIFLLVKYEPSNLLHEPDATPIKDVLRNRIEQEYTCRDTDLVIQILNPHKCHLWFNGDCAV